MRTRLVAVDGSFLTALLSEGDGHHDEAVATFADLLEGYERGEVLLITHRGIVRGLRGHDGLADAVAPIEITPLDRGLRRRARQIIGANPELGLDEELALLLVVMRDEHTDEIASFDPRLDALNVHAMPYRPAPSVAAATEDGPDQGSSLH